MMVISLHSRAEITNYMNVSFKILSTAFAYIILVTKMKDKTNEVFLHVKCTEFSDF